MSLSCVGEPVKAAISLPATPMSVVIPLKVMVALLLRVRDANVIEVAPPAVESITIPALPLLIVSAPPLVAVLEPIPLSRSVPLLRAKTPVPNGLPLVACATPTNVPLLTVVPPV